MAKARKFSLGIEAIFDARTHLLSDKEDRSIEYLNHQLLKPCAYQPRKIFTDDSLEELADSLQQHGFLQPILVRSKNDYFEIIAGERRWRAAKIAGIDFLPCIICSVTEDDVLIYSLIENIQREDLNPIEEAKALQNITVKNKLTHTQLSTMLGKSRSHLTNILRLLKLRDEVVNYIYEKRIEMGHARALLTLPFENQLEIANIVVSKELSVRQTEVLVKNTMDGAYNTALDDYESALLLGSIERIKNDYNKRITIKKNRGGSYTVNLKIKSIEELNEIFPEKMCV